MAFWWCPEKDSLQGKHSSMERGWKSSNSVTVSAKGQEETSQRPGLLAKSEGAVRDSEFFSNQAITGKDQSWDKEVMTRHSLAIFKWLRSIIFVLSKLSFNDSKTETVASRSKQHQNKKDQWTAMQAHLASSWSAYWTNCIRFCPACENLVRSREVYVLLGTGKIGVCGNRVDKGLKVRPSEF